jgi:diadenosine tetraphosphatase ApaH/serine/threonine PP2A family protein phosphatase
LILAEVDWVVVGGDVVPGSMPYETLARLLDLGIPVEFIRGNGESAALAYLAGTDPGSLPEQAREDVRWSAEPLHPGYERLLASWPGTLCIEIPGLGEVPFCHATPRSDTEISTRLTPDERPLPLCRGLDAPMIVYGHIHVQLENGPMEQESWLDGPSLKGGIESVEAPAVLRGESTPQEPHSLGG